MVHAASSPTLVFDSGLKRYIEKIRRFPLLEQQEELHLARRWRSHSDRDALQRLVTSHLRLVVKMAVRYRGYGLPIAEVISEGNVGLMQAAERFDPERGFRFSTYAIWWIRAATQAYILRSKSLVKMGTTENQRKLFFKLRAAKSRISALGEGDMRPDQVKLIAESLGVTEQDVTDMNRRLGGDVSLNVATAKDGDSGNWQDQLVDDAPNQEWTLVSTEEAGNRRKALAQALNHLDGRERRIFEARRLAERPRRLEELATEFCISPERVRQLEARAFERIRNLVRRGVVATRIAEMAPAY
jgi:RNA polymerase sigma-32 factor